MASVAHDRDLGAGGSLQETLFGLLQGLSEGTRLPSERDLARQLGVSRNGLREALASLERSGHIRRKVGRGGGTFVALPKLERDLRYIASLPEYLRQQGHVPGARVISAQLIEARGETVEKLGGEGPLVYELVRVRLSDGEPLSLEHSQLPARRFPGLLEQPLGGSIYTLMREIYQAGPHRAVERIEAVQASDEDAGALDVPPGAPLLCVDRVAYDTGGRVVEVGHELFRGDRTRVVVWVEEGDQAVQREDRVHVTPRPGS
ncbi:MAG: GntR family transcriptional regulator [Acidimicrobiales bacterium]